MIRSSGLGFQIYWALLYDSRFKYFNGNIKIGWSHKSTILQLVDRLIVNPKGVLEDVMVSIDS